MNLAAELSFAWRSMLRSKGLFLTVVATLALGIGANAAIFSVVRGVLLRPLANRDEDRLIYIRQSAPGISAENATFSVPEIQDLRQRVTSLAALGEFSTITFTMVGLGDARQVRAGVVDGRFFEVMGLRPVLGRLLAPSDDGASAAGAAVLTHRFWMTGLKGDPAVIGKTVRLGTRSAEIVGVLEPSVPYPTETEVIANVVTSPHHLSASMVTGREHRMTELFGRLAPGADLEAARAELRTAHGAIRAAYPEAYPARSDFRIDAVRLRDQITSEARTVLWILMAAAALIFLIALSNVANLILARSVQREAELSVRAALGAGRAALRRTLLAEALVLCGAGALLGVVIAQPMVSILGRYASRFSIRALDLSLDPSLLWVGAGLAMVAAVVLAFVPRLPQVDSSRGLGAASGGLRLTSSTRGRLSAFAVTQIAASFILLAGAGMLVRTLLSLEQARPAFASTSVLAVNVPVTSYGRSPEQVRGFYRDLRQRLSEVAGVERVAMGSTVPWRDTTRGGDLEFAVEGRTAENAGQGPRAKFRAVSPGFFAALGLPLVAGRDFNDADRDGAERVVVVSESLARTMFPNQDPLNRRLTWTDGIIRFIGVAPEPRRIVGVVADLDDENVTPIPTMTVYHPFEQELGGGRLFLHASGDPYALVPTITRVVKEMAIDQPVERAATLADIRAEVIAPDRVNALMFGGVAVVALLIAVVGVAGVLAFSVSGRTREFGVRLAVGSQPASILRGVVGEGARMALVGVAVGAAGGLAVWRLLGSVVTGLQWPGAVPLLAAALILMAAATAAALTPALRASRVDVVKALRAD